MRQAVRAQVRLRFLPSIGIVLIVLLFFIWPGNRVLICVAAARQMIRELLKLLARLLLKLGREDLQVLILLLRQLT